ncbi:MAG: Zinc/iron permease, partial [Parcubacteria group bacterium GW2011_GWC2_42_12]
KFNSFLMAFTAGAMIFISLHELVPQAKSYKKPALFFLGLILSALVLWAMNLLIRV